MEVKTIEQAMVIAKTPYSFGINACRLLAAEADYSVERLNPHTSNGNTVALRSYWTVKQFKSMRNAGEWLEKTLNNIDN